MLVSYRYATEGKILLWDIDSNRETTTFDNESSVFHLSASKDILVASLGFHYSYINLYDMQNGKILTKIPTYKKEGTYNAVLCTKNNHLAFYVKSKIVVYRLRL